MSSDPHKWHLTMFGDITVTAPGSRLAVPVKSAQSRVFLAALAAAPAHRMTRDALVGTLWPDGAEPSSAWRVALKRTRDIFSPDGLDLIATTAHWYELSSAHVDLDVDRWVSLVRSAERLGSEDQRKAIATYQEASKLWIGDPFFGIDDIDIIDVARRSLLSMRVNVTLHELELLTEVDPTAAAYRAESMVALAPLREDLVVAAMTGLWLGNQRTEAVTMGATFRERLRDELGLSPTDEFLSVERRILQPVPDGSGQPPAANAWSFQAPSPSDATPPSSATEYVAPPLDAQDLSALMREAEHVGRNGNPTRANELLWQVVTQADARTEVDLMIRAAYAGASHAGRVGGDYERRQRLQVALDRMGSHALRDEVLADFALESANCGHRLDPEVDRQVREIAERPESPGHTLAFRWLVADRHMSGRASLEDAEYLAGLCTSDDSVSAHQHAAGLAVAVTVATAFGVLDLAEKWAVEMEYRGAHHGHPRGRWQALAFQSVIAEMVGRTDRSDDCAKRAYEYGSTMGIADAESTFGLLFFARAYRAGSIAAFAPMLASVEAQYKYPLWTMCRALAEWQSGNELVARQLFRSGRAEILGRVDRFTTPTLGIATDVACALGLVDEAVQLDRALADVQEPFLMLGYGGPCIAHKNAVRAQVARLAGNTDDAVALIDAARQECIALGAHGMTNDLTRPGDYVP